MLPMYTSDRQGPKSEQLPESLGKLRHRLSGRVNLKSVHSGPQPMFSNEEEAYLVAMAECGYGYGRAEVLTIASENAVYLEKRDQDHPLSMKWFRGFM
ncbi:hypothetical protein DPMN_147549 [Dreissena polymorpha]|uniref:Uncharacterized protein n=1 Tax=Dreissena polymorpha TaxID=45954 RepID=A0A9D4F830_DREPO|nr:hypothetical protein DPMN_147549 [Dreissena polymorpha]